MTSYTILNEIQQLDPEEEHERIVFLSTCYDFPFDTTRALELALFRTFCVPSIASLLDRTGEFHNRPQKRYDDTGIIVSEMLEWGYSSERGTRHGGMFGIRRPLPRRRDIESSDERFDLPHVLGRGSDDQYAGRCVRHNENATTVLLRA